MLFDQKEKTRTIIQNVLESEMGYLFTNDNKEFNTFLSKIYNFINKSQCKLTNYTLRLINCSNEK